MSLIAGTVTFLLGPFYGYFFDLASPSKKKLIILITSLIGTLSTIVLLVPFVIRITVSQENKINLIAFYFISFSYGITICGHMTTGGPLRSFAFSKEKELIMSFACYRFIYYFSIAFAFFVTMGIN